MDDSKEEREEKRIDHLAAMLDLSAFVNEMEFPSGKPEFDNRWAIREVQAMIDNGALKSVISLIALVREMDERGLINFPPGVKKSKPPHLIIVPGGGA